MGSTTAHHLMILERIEIMKTVLQFLVATLSLTTTALALFMLAADLQAEAIGVAMIAFVGWAHLAIVTIKA